MGRRDGADASALQLSSHDRRRCLQPSRLPRRALLCHAPRGVLLLVPAGHTAAARRRDDSSATPLGVCSCVPYRRDAREQRAGAETRLARRSRRAVGRTPSGSHARAAWQAARTGPAPGGATRPPPTGHTASGVAGADDSSATPLGVCSCPLSHRDTPQAAWQRSAGLLPRPSGCAPVPLPPTTPQAAWQGGASSALDAVPGGGPLVVAWPLDEAPADGVGVRVAARAQQAAALAIGRLKPPPASQKRRRPSERVSDASTPGRSTSQSASVARAKRLFTRAESRDAERARRREHVDVLRHDDPSMQDQLTGRGRREEKDNEGIPGRRAVEKRELAFTGEGHVPDGFGLPERPLGAVSAIHVPVVRPPHGSTLAEVPALCHAPRGVLSSAAFPRHTPRGVAEDGLNLSLASSGFASRRVPPRSDRSRRPAPRPARLGMHPSRRVPPRRDRSLRPLPRPSGGGASPRLSRDTPQGAWQRTD